MQHRGELRLRAKPHSAELRLRAMPHSAELGLRAMLHSAESQLPAMLHSAEFFRIAGSRNKILFAFTEAVKVTVFQKIGQR
jgi:hypothetical protein